MDLTPEQIQQYMGIFTEQLGAHIGSHIASFLKNSSPGSGTGGAKEVEVRRLDPEWDGEGRPTYIVQKTTVSQLLAEIADGVAYLCNVAEEYDGGEEYEEEEDDQEIEDQIHVRRGNNSNNSKNKKRKK